MDRPACRRAIAASVVALAAALAIAGASPRLRADDERPASRVFADVVAHATETGAIGRVLRTHPFLFTRTFYDHEGKQTGDVEMLMTYRIGIIPEDDALQLTVEVLPRGRGVAVRIRYVVGLDDGKLRRLDGTFPQGWVRARVADGKIRVARDLQGGTGEHEEKGEYDWDDRTLPKIVGAFILPMLHDQGAPKKIVYRDLDAFGTLRAPATPRAAGLDDDGHLVYGSDEGRQELSTTIHVAAEGAQEGLLQKIRTISEVHVDPETKKEKVAHLALSVRISSGRFEALLPEFSEKPEEGEGEPKKDD